MINSINPIPVTPPSWQQPSMPEPGNSGIVPPWLREPFVILPIIDPDEITLPVITDPVQ